MGRFFWFCRIIVAGRIPEDMDYLNSIRKAVFKLGMSRASRPYEMGATFVKHL
jgi:hypothetical protein